MNRQFKRKERKEEMLLGLSQVIEAVKEGKSINKIFVEQGNGGPLLNELKNVLKGTHISYQVVPEAKLKRLTQKPHKGAVAFLSPIPFYELEEVVPTLFEAGKTPLIYILDRVTDVRNFGAIVRSAECHGVDAIVIPSRGAASINMDALKTSTGALKVIPICRSFNLKHAISFLQQSGIEVVGCTEKTDDLLTNHKFENPVAIIMGSEEDGISNEYLKMCDAKVKIPMYGEVASLNVAVSASIVMYEIQRQRNA